MEQIEIIFYVLATFFGQEEGRIAADKTLVTINPKTQQIEIYQQDLFGFVQTDKDIQTTKEQWQELVNEIEKNTELSPSLQNFSLTNAIVEQKENPEVELNFKYKKASDLRVMGIWYNDEKNQFSINQISTHNIKTKDGSLDGNYWIFDGTKPFSFTIEPFLQMPEEQLKYKMPLEKLLKVD